MTAGRALGALGLGAAAVAGAGAVVASQPPALARLLARRRGVFFHGATSAREVALTLDDGPHPALTPHVLDALARQGARATFFVLGSRVAAHPETARAVVAAGHEVGNHGWADAPAVLQPADRFRHGLVRTSAVVREATGAVPTLTRPGSGLVRPGQVRAAAALGLRTVLGSVAVPDAEVHDVGAAARFVLDRVQPGAVVVLHEGLPTRHRVVDLLDTLLPQLSRQGFRCVTMSELIAAGGPGAAPAPGQSSIS